jgi:hypothetical protein
MAYVDVEKLLVGWFETQTTGVRYCTELPAKFETDLPVVRFTRVSGSDDPDAVNLDVPIVDVDLFHTDLESAMTLALSTHSLLRKTLRGQTVNGQTVGRVDAATSFRPLPWDNTMIRRLGATYALYIASLV